MNHNATGFEPEGCQIANKAILLATGDLSAMESLRIRVHMIFCQECRQRLKVHRAIHGALIAIDGPTIVPGSATSTNPRIKIAVAGLALAAVVAAGWLYTSWALGENSSRLPAAAASGSGERESKNRSKARGSEDASLERCEEK